MRRYGRLVEKVKLPPELVVAVRQEALRRGQPVERVAGDLIAEALPAALAEAATNLLAEGRRALQLEMLEALGSEPSMNKCPGLYTPGTSTHSPVRQPATSDSPSGSRVAARRALSRGEAAHGQAVS